MSYNGSGTFVINSTGQPVVTGTVISSSTFNSLTADLGTGLSTAITKDGQTTTTAKIPFAQGLSAAVASNFAAGTVGAPSIYLSTDTTTGLYRIGANNVGFAVSGVKLLDLGSALVGITGALTVSTTLNVTGVATLGNGAVLGTPASGTVTNLTGTASININGTVGATTATTGAFTSGTFSTTLGVSGLLSFVGTAATQHQAFRALGTTTAAHYFGMDNTTASLVCGIENSVGSNLFPSSLAYSAVFGTNSAGAVHIASNNVITLTSNAAGTGITIPGTLGVTGAITASANVWAVNGLEVQGSHASNRANMLAFNNSTGDSQLYAYGSTTGAGGRGTFLFGGIDSAGANDLNYITIANTGAVTIPGTLANGPQTVTGIVNSQAIYAVDPTTGTSGTGTCLFIQSYLTSGTGGSVFAFYNNTAVAYKMLLRPNGSFENATGTYGAISDAKLKENIVDANPKLSKVLALKVRNYNFIGSDEKHIGFVAQEIEQIMPGLVSESADADAEGNDLGTTTKSVKMSILVPILVKAIQEMNEVINAQAARIAALEAK